MKFIENIGTILITAIIIILPLLIILIVIEKKLKRKMKKGSQNKYYISKIKKINQFDSKKSLESIDKIARKFFEEAFSIKKFTGYSELKKFFNQKKETKIIEFCELMTLALYSKEKKNIQIKELINLFSEIVETHEIEDKENK